MKYSRQEAVQKIRHLLITNMRNDETTCQAMARMGVFCRGYDQWTTEQLRELYPWLAKKLSADARREELLLLIIAWDGARTLVNGVATTCDAKSLDHEGCLGFDGFTNDQLKAKFASLFGTEDEISQ